MSAHLLLQKRLYLTVYNNIIEALVFLAKAYFYFQEEIKMNIIDKLMKIDAGTLETPKAIHKMYVKKIGEELEFEIEAINAEKATEIQQKAIKIENGNVSDIDVYKTKVLTIMEGCPMFKDKALREHFKAPTPKELINKLLLKGEVDDLVDAINNLSDLKKIEKAEDEIKN